LLPPAAGEPSRPPTKPPTPAETSATTRTTTRTAQVGIPRRGGREPGAPIAASPPGGGIGGAGGTEPGGGPGGCIAPPAGSAPGGTCPPGPKGPGRWAGC